jgi:hypothetical protein
MKADSVNVLACMGGVRVPGSAANAVPPAGAAANSPTMNLNKMRNCVAMNSPLRSVTGTIAAREIMQQDPATTPG